MRRSPRTTFTTVTTIATLAACVAASAVAACAATETTSPDARGSASRTGDAPPGDTARGTTGGAPAGGAPNGAAPDTARPAPTGTSRVQGRVRVATWRAPAAGSADTTQLAPVAGATLRLFRNVLENGQGVSRFVTQTTSASDGSYSFGPIEAGYYLVYTSIPGVSGEHLEYLAATAAEVTLNVTVWRREGGAAPPDTTGR